MDTKREMARKKLNLEIGKRDEPQYRLPHIGRRNLGSLSYKLGGTVPSNRVKTKTLTVKC